MDNIDLFDCMLIKSIPKACESCRDNLGVTNQFKLYAQNHMLIVDYHTRKIQFVS